MRSQWESLSCRDSMKKHCCHNVSLLDVIISVASMGSTGVGWVSKENHEPGSLLRLSPTYGHTAGQVGVLVYGSIFLSGRITSQFESMVCRNFVRSRRVCFGGESWLRYSFKAFYPNMPNGQLHRSFRHRKCTNYYHSVRFWSQLSKYHMFHKIPSV